MFWTICKYLPFTSKNNCQEENLGNNFFIFYFRPPKWAKLFLTLTKKNRCFLSLSSFLPLTKGHCICSSSDMLDFHAEIENIFGTVWRGWTIIYTYSAYKCLADIPRLQLMMGHNISQQPVNVQNVIKEKIININK